MQGNGLPHLLDSVFKTLPQLTGGALGAFILWLLSRRVTLIDKSKADSAAVDVAKIEAEKVERAEFRSDMRNSIERLDRQKERLESRLDEEERRRHECEQARLLLQVELEKIRRQSPNGN